MTNFFKATLYIVILLSGVGSKLCGANPQLKPLPCLNKTFTILPHIVRDSLGNPGITELEILNAIDLLNTYFDDICVSFEICEFRYIDNYQYNKLEWDNEWQEIGIKNHEKNRINMYFVKELEDPGICGRAVLGGVANLGDGGIAILKKCVGSSKTITHEMGHYFGLLHTFGSAVPELVDGSNCAVSGDGICDTPADPYVDGEPVANYVDNSCRFISMKKDANGDFYTPDVGNIMSYYPDNCSCAFTYQQYLKMVATYQASNPKMW